MKLPSRRFAPFLVAAGCALLPAAVRAAVSEAEAEALGRTLTPLGAEKAGNADGSIPAWTGGLVNPPAGYKPGGHHPDPNLVHAKELVAQVMPEGGPEPGPAFALS